MGSRGATSSINKKDKDLVRYYKNLLKVHESRLKTTPKEADVTRDAIKNAIEFANKRIKELSDIRNTDEYKAMMKYTNTKRDSDFKDYIQLDNGNIIARAKNGTYSVIEGSKFIVDGERIPSNNMYMATNSSLTKDLKKIDSKKFKKIK